MSWVWVNKCGKNWYHSTLDMVKICFMLFYSSYLLCFTTTSTHGERVIVPRFHNKLTFAHRWNTKTKKKTNKTNPTSFLLFDVKRKGKMKLKIRLPNFFHSNESIQQENKFENISDFSCKRSKILLYSSQNK